MQMNFVRHIMAVVCAIMVAHMASAYSLRENPAFAALFPATSLQYSNITAAQLVGLYNNNENLKIFDVREPDEFADGHIPTATNVPLSTIETGYTVIPMDGPVFIHCRSGVRSLKAIGILESLGYGNLINVVGGFMGWVEAGGEVVKENAVNKSELQLALEAMNLKTMPTTLHPLFF